MTDSSIIRISRRSALGRTLIGFLVFLCIGGPSAYASPGGGGSQSTLAWSLTDVIDEQDILLSNANAGDQVAVSVNANSTIVEVARYDSNGDKIAGSEVEVEAGDSTTVTCGAGESVRVNLHEDALRAKGTYEVNP